MEEASLHSILDNVCGVLKPFVPFLFLLGEACKDFK